jgi:hypothetical protein
MGTSPTRNFNCSSANAGSLKGHSPEHLYGRAEQTRSPAYKYAASIVTELLGIRDLTQKDSRIYVADPKPVDTIIEKSMRDYDGDTRRIKDAARLTVFVNTLKEMQKVLKNFACRFPQDQKFNEDKATVGDNGGYKIHEIKDYIAKPKALGYMALYLIIEHKGDKFEVQLYPESMLPVYRATHALYEQIRRDVEDCYKNGLSLREGLSEDKLKIAQQILAMHKAAAIESGIFQLIEGDFPTVDDPPPVFTHHDISPYPQDILPKASWEVELEESLLRAREMQLTYGHLDS